VFATDTEAGPLAPPSSRRDRRRGRAFAAFLATSLGLLLATGALAS
jgi:hypothetical protein